MTNNKVPTMEIDKPKKGSTITDDVNTESYHTSG